MNKADIERELVLLAGVHAVVEERGDRLIVSGQVSSEEARQAAFDVLAVLAPSKEVIDNLELNVIMPAQVGQISISEAEAGGFRPATPGTEDSEALEPGDFTDQRLLQDAGGEMGPAALEGDISDQDVSEGEEVYVPPIDPVMDADNRVVGGFSISSMDSIEVDGSASDNKLGDEAIAEAVRRELLEDSTTNGMSIEVSVERGVVRLRGTVLDVIDAENAEEVASRVPGVIEVLEELDVTSGAF